MKKSYIFILAVCFLGGSSLTDAPQETLNAGFFNSNAAEEGEKGCEVFGEIEFVDHGGDYEVEFVDYNADLDVEYVDYGADDPGEWEVVDHGGDFEIERVDYGGDFTVEVVDYNPGCN